MRSTLVVGNWKMNGSLASMRTLIADIRKGADTCRATLAVIPPFVYLAETEQLLTGGSIRWGAQNVSEHTAGAYTGEIAPAMLQDFGCTYVLVGHSERRTLYGENDATVARKFAAARAAGLTPVLCIGETLAERERHETETVIARQLDSVLDLEGVQSLADAVIAYEPVWAIGTGKTASPEQAQAVHEFIRSKVAQLDATIGASIVILYGGSVKAANANELFAMPDIDGGLIGGASLNADEFLKIAQAAQ